MAKVTNTSFFQQKPEPEKKPNAPRKVKKENFGSEPVRSTVHVSNRLIAALNETVQALNATGRKDAALEMKKICNGGLRNRFTVAVVGEFSRGKSTFVNTLLGREVLPVGDLPTTAMLTRIRYNSKECMVHFNLKNEREATLPLSEESWDGLVAENLGRRDPTGTVLVGIDDPWLKHYNIELMDTPGAGDLEDKRAQVIGEVLYGCDGAIITVSATAPLSLSEKLFIEQRLISRRTPFLMLVVTKLDQVRLEERAGVIEYIREKLASWNMDIPVFVPYDVELDDDRFADIMGMDRIKREMISWMNDPERLRRTEAWLTGQALAVLDRELLALQEQKLLAESDDATRRELIEEKKLQLKKAEIFWEDLRLEMLKRSNKCYAQLMGKADEYAATITERLQYEVSHSQSPSKWWQEDYSYRLKVELTNMASGIENTVMRTVSDDIRWFNTALDQNFKTHVLGGKEPIYDKTIVADAIRVKELEFENLDKKRNIAKIGTTAASLVGAALFMASGGWPLIATMGIGTGAGILTDSFFKKKVDRQRDQIKDTLEKEVPRIVTEATADSESRLRAIYDSVMEAAVEKEEAWKNTQLAAIENGVKSKDAEQAKRLDAEIRTLESLKQKITSI